MTKLFHQVLTGIVLRIDELKQHQCKDWPTNELRDQWLSELEYQYDLLYETVKELIFLDRPEEIDRVVIQALTRYELPF